MASIIVTGFAPSNKDPGFKATTIFHTGRSSGNLFARSCLLVGQMSSGAAATANTVYNIQSEADCTQFGVRSELSQMILGALKVSGVTLYAVGHAAGSGPTASTCTLTVTGTWTVGGTVLIRLAGQIISVGMVASESVTQAAVRIKNAVNGITNLPMTADNTAGVVTVTVDCASPRGDFYIIHKDMTDAPSGMSIALAGGTGLASGGVPFTGGVGAESVTTMLTALLPQHYDRVALPQVLTGPLAAWAAQADVKAGALEGRLEHYVIAANTTAAAANAIVDFVQNPRFQVLWCRNCETHPSVIAATWAAYRSVYESSNPSPRYTYSVVTGVAPQQYLADRPTGTERNAALNTGLTPLTTLADGKVYVVRSITCYYQTSGSTQDTRCLDTNQATMPDYARERIKQIWEEDLSPNYAYVRDDPGTNEKAPPAGVLYPRLVKVAMYAESKVWEDNGWIINADSNLPVCVYDTTGRRVMSDWTIVPSPLNEQLGVNFRQAAS